MKIQDNNIIRDATPEEEAENASKHQQFLDEKQAREAKEALKTSAKAKLVAGTPLTEEEANTIVL